VKQTIERYLFAQPNVEFRIFVMRVAIALVIVAYVTFGPYDYFHADAASLLYRPDGLLAFIPPLGRLPFYALKGLVLVSGIAFGFGLWTRVSGVLLMLSYFVFAYYTGHFSTALFSYITHLNFFLIALCFVRCDRFWSIDGVRRGTVEPLTPAQAQVASFVLAFMQLYVIGFYVQAGLGKWLASGFAWFLTGDTPYYGSIVAGLPSGLALTEHRWVYPCIGIFTAIFEIGFFMILWPPLRRLYCVGVIGFHLGILFTLNIFFWQLSIMVPLLFLFNGKLDTRRACLGLFAYLLLMIAIVVSTPLPAYPLGTTDGFMPASAPSQALP
jgi:hypothetical protein